MSSHSAEDVKKHTWIYFTVFGSLALLTVLTVAVASLELAMGAAVVLALAIATLKSSLVASFFMHLVTEKKLILIVLFFTVIFFVALILLPLSDVMDNVGVRHVP